MRSRRGVMSSHLSSVMQIQNYHRVSTWITYSPSPPHPFSNSTLLNTLAHFARFIMHSFTRLLSALTLLLSLGFVVNAMPPAHRPGLISYRQQSTPGYYGRKPAHYERDQLSGANDQTGHSRVNVPGKVWTLKGKLDPKLALLAKSKSIDDAKDMVQVILAIIKVQSSRLANVSVNVSIEARLEMANIVINLFFDLITACARLSLKFDAPLVTTLLPDIDTAFSGYLLALTSSVPGLGPVLIKLATNINADVTSDLRIVGMAQCVQLLGLVNKVSGVAP
ncbi:unnamed protein product [Rhizoctonia solani]|uniref:Transmembrane protein n=3 Tax=Rhizoctonia solani TaxID=456999 RepID=A0A8H2WWT2_9AGAM|nr:transmembrane protein, putative [Rhizoctonia solani AG-3 Rhs1AP]KEP48744.1 putative transmembrane protein [Rhizoctonia solani 123E]CAE6411666.1 unnamed protein product [Rhizoctonia solani]CAE6504725.1 unnamed protein product [Rhizoctonia solani]